MPRSGVIGEQIFQQVEQLVKGGLSRTDAFKQISSESGRREGTVAANYYRVARKRAGGSLRPRRGRGRTRTTAASPRRARTVTARRAGEADIDALANSLVQNVQALAAAMTAQAAEVKDLRARLDGVRKLLA
ncbi:MAG TPA: hypothetical protein VE777_04665 [Gaiellales bacterium]|jgi:hypothetical protein|nr:hypothetical protein [Gaiellales bacterium]